MCQCQAHQPFVLQKLWLVLNTKGEQDHWHHDCLLDKCFHGNGGEEMQSNNN